MCLHDFKIIDDTTPIPGIECAWRRSETVCHPARYSTAADSIASTAGVTRALKAASDSALSRSNQVPVPFVDRLERALRGDKVADDPRRDGRRNRMLFETL